MTTVAEMLPESPGWQKAGRYAFWTEERVRAALNDFAASHPGRLPHNSDAYTAMKSGRLRWPTAAMVLRMFGSMADAWEAIGIPRSRVSRNNLEWTAEDEDYLLERAGTETLRLVGKHLGRTAGSCKARLAELGAGHARDIPGLLSAAEVARTYHCPLDRVIRLLRSGELKGHHVKGGHYWRVEPDECERMKAVLEAPKRTYKGSPPDVGNYEARYGLRRHHGKRVPA